MRQDELLPHLFRTEFSKITAVLSKLFGLEYLEAAEDIASETFLAAAETWSFKGSPPNPTAWLYAVAKNKARNYLVRHQLFNGKVAPDIKASADNMGSIEIDLSESNITD